MHAMILQGAGKCYISALFGFYRDISADRNSENCLSSIYNTYWIVWDANGERLVKWQTYVPKTKYIIPQILIVDSYRGNWNMDEDGVGCVDFLSKELLDTILGAELQPVGVLEKCRAMDSGYVYNATPEIKTPKDIEDLSWASGDFHDARIEKEELLENGTLHLMFDGTWGCKIEVWFWGDLEYDTSSRNPEDHDPYWFGSTILIDDGFVYLVDGEDMTVDMIGPGVCFFKARHMKYRIIPN